MTRSSASLADVLEILVGKWPVEFTAVDVTGIINNQSPNDEEQTLRNFLLPGAQPHHMFTAKAVGRSPKRHLDEPVKSGERTLVLRRKQDVHTNMFSYCVEGAHP